MLALPDAGGPGDRSDRPGPYAMTGLRWVAVAARLPPAPTNALRGVAHGRGGGAPRPPSHAASTPRRRWRGGSRRTRRCRFVSTGRGPEHPRCSCGACPRPCRSSTACSPSRCRWEPRRCSSRADTPRDVAVARTPVRFPAMPGDLIVSGHGKWDPANAAVTLPSGTTVKFYADFMRVDHRRERPAHRALQRRARTGRADRIRGRRCVLGLHDLPTDRSHHLPQGRRSCRELRLRPVDRRRRVPPEPTAPDAGVPEPHPPLGRLRRGRSRLCRRTVRRRQRGPGEPRPGRLRAGRHGAVLRRRSLRHRSPPRHRLPRSEPSGRGAIRRQRPRHGRGRAGTRPISSTCGAASNPTSATACG